MYVCTLASVGAQTGVCVHALGCRAMDCRTHVCMAGSVGEGCMAGSVGAGGEAPPFGCVHLSLGSGVCGLFVCVGHLFVCVGHLFVCVGDLFVCVDDLFSHFSLGILHTHAHTF